MKKQKLIKHGLTTLLVISILKGITKITKTPLIDVTIKIK